jgi:hypothetical protein
VAKYYMRRVGRRVHLSSQRSGGVGRQRTYLSPRHKVYRFIDEMVEGTRSQGELLESLRRWWDSMLFRTGDCAKGFAQRTCKI